MRQCFLLFFLASCCTSCMDLKLNFDLQADRRLNTQLHLSMLGQLFDNAILLAAQSGMNLDFLKEESLKEFASRESGVVRAYSNREVDGMRQIDLDIQFEDGIAFLGKIAPGNLTVKQEGELYTISILDNELGKSMKSLDQAAVDQQMSMFQTLLPGLVWEIEVKVPELVDSNLSKPGGSRALFRFDYDKDLANKSGVAAVQAYTRFLETKWIRFKGLK